MPTKIEDVPVIGTIVKWGKNALDTVNSLLESGKTAQEIATVVAAKLADNAAGKGEMESLEAVIKKEFGLNLDDKDLGAVINCLSDMGVVINEDFGSSIGNLNLNDTVVLKDDLKKEGQVIDTTNITEGIVSVQFGEDIVTIEESKLYRKLIKEEKQGFQEIMDDMFANATSKPFSDLQQASPNRYDEVRAILQKLYDNDKIHNWEDMESFVCTVPEIGNILITESAEKWYIVDSVANKAVGSADTEDEAWQKCGEIENSEGFFVYSATQCKDNNVDLQSVPMEEGIDMNKYSPTDHKLVNFMIGLGVTEENIDKILPILLNATEADIKTIVGDEKIASEIHAFANGEDVNEDLMDSTLINQPDDVEKFKVFTQLQDYLKANFTAGTHYDIVASGGIRVQKSVDDKQISDFITKINESVDDLRFKVGDSLTFPSNYKNKTLAGRGGEIKKIEGDTAYLHMSDNADVESMWLPVPLEQLSMNESLTKGDKVKSTDELEINKYYSLKQDKALYRIKYLGPKGDKFTFENPVSPTSDKWELGADEIVDKVELDESLNESLQQSDVEDFVNSNTSIKVEDKQPLIDRILSDYSNTDDLPTAVEKAIADLGLSLVEESLLTESQDEILKIYQNTLSKLTGDKAEEFKQKFDAEIEGPMTDGSLKDDEAMSKLNDIVKSFALASNESATDNYVAYQYNKNDEEVGRKEFSNKDEALLNAPMLVVDDVAYVEVYPPNPNANTGKPIWTNKKKNDVNEDSQDDSLTKFKTALDKYCTKHGCGDDVNQRAIELFDELVTKADQNLLDKWLNGDGKTLVLMDLLKSTTYRGNGNTPEQLLDFNAFCTLDSANHHKKLGDLGESKKGKVNEANSDKEITDAIRKALPNMQVILTLNKVGAQAYYYNTAAEKFVPLYNITAFLNGEYNCKDEHLERAKQSATEQGLDVEKVKLSSIPTQGEYSGGSDKMLKDLGINEEYDREKSRADHKAKIEPIAQKWLKCSYDDLLSTWVDDDDKSMAKIIIGVMNKIDGGAKSLETIKDKPNTNYMASDIYDMDGIKVIFTNGQPDGLMFNKADKDKLVAMFKDIDLNESKLNEDKSTAEIADIVSYNSTLQRYIDPKSVNDDAKNYFNTELKGFLTKNPEYGVIDEFSDKVITDKQKYSEFVGICDKTVELMNLKLEEDGESLITESLTQRNELVLESVQISDPDVYERKMQRMNYIFENTIKVKVNEDVTRLVEDKKMKKEDAIKQVAELYQVSETAVKEKIDGL